MLVAVRDKRTSLLRPVNNGRCVVVVLVCLPVESRNGRSVRRRAEQGTMQTDADIVQQTKLDEIDAGCRDIVQYSTGVSRKQIACFEGRCCQWRLLSSCRRCLATVESSRSSRCGDGGVCRRDTPDLSSDKHTECGTARYGSIKRKRGKGESLARSARTWKTRARWIGSMLSRCPQL